MTEDIIVVIQTESGLEKGITYPNYPTLASNINKDLANPNSILYIIGDLDRSKFNTLIGFDFYTKDNVILHYHGLNPRIIAYKDMETIITVDFKQVTNDVLSFRNLYKIEGEFDYKRYAERLLKHTERMDDTSKYYDMMFAGTGNDLDLTPLLETELIYLANIGGAFFKSTYNKNTVLPYVEDWSNSEFPIWLDYWFAFSEYNKELDYLEFSGVSSLRGAFYKAKFNQPLGKGMFALWKGPIDLVLTFAESEFYQDLSKWTLDPKSTCDGMFYNSRYTIEEVSQWEWVKELKQPVEDLFRLTDKARECRDYIIEKAKAYGPDATKHTY